MKAISANSAAMTALVALVGALFAFLKWLDARALEQKEKRRQRYERLIAVILGQEVDGRKPVVFQQIVAVWMLSEFSEFEFITRKIFLDRDHSEFSPEVWRRVILSEIKEMLGSSRR